MLNKKKRDFNFVAFAVAQSDKNQKTNASNARIAEGHMKRNDIPFNKCIGSYKGQLENSYVVSEDSFHKLRDIIFDVFDQESVLHVEPDNTAHLLYQNGNIEKLGTLEKTGIQKAIENAEAFTIHGKFAYVINS